MLSALKNLDDVTWADLAEQGRALIVAPGPPAARPIPGPSEWTDHNASDPGITLLELLAWIAEQNVYRINRVPERIRHLALALCGLHVEPARAARVLLAFNTSAGPIDVPESLTCSSGIAGAPRYRTLEPMTAVPGAIEEIKLEAAGRWTNLAWILQRGEAPPLFGSDPQPGDSLYLGLSDAPSAGAVSLGVLLAGVPPGELGAGPHHDVTLSWEIAVSGGWRFVTPTDRTRSLTLTGTVTLPVPAGVEARVIDGGPPRYWIRCRIASGYYDRPPLASRLFLNAVEAEQSIPPAPSGVAPAPDAYRLGVCTGDPYQRLRLPLQYPVLGSMTLFTLEGPASSYQRIDWELRYDLIASGPADAHYTLDHIRNEVVFGDGERGRLAPWNSPCYVEYLATQGAAGAVPAGVIKQIDPSPYDLSGLSVVNPAASSAGSDPETVELAGGRATEAVDGPTRAMTVDDIASLCLNLPGTHIARAEVIPNFLPGLAGVRATGVTTVVIVPAGGGTLPQPSQGLLSTVSAYLDERRIIGSRIVVTAPTYIEVSVKAKVKSLRGAGAAQLERSINGKLSEFLHPLRGGENGSGWPLGRSVYRSEILQLLDGVPGVDHVLSLELIPGTGQPVCGNLCIPANGLTFSGRHSIEVI